MICKTENCGNLILFKSFQMTSNIVNHVPNLIIPQEEEFVTLEQETTEPARRNVPASIEDSMDLKQITKRIKGQNEVLEIAHEEEEEDAEEGNLLIC